MTITATAAAEISKEPGAFLMASARPEGCGGQVSPIDEVGHAGHGSLPEIASNNTHSYSDASFNSALVPRRLRNQANVLFI
jgi:hypothetical protein